MRFSTWGYDASGRATSSEHAGGVEHYSFVYNSNGSRVVTDPLGTAHTYATTFLAGQRRYTSSNATCGGCSEFATVTYDSYGNFDTRTDFNGSQTKTLYDQTRNLEIYRAEAYGTAKVRASATTWHASFRKPTLVTESGRTTAFTYDGSGNVLTRTVTDTSSTPNVSRVWTYTYNSYGQVLTADGPRSDVSDVTTYTYYTCTTGSECGRVHTITNALGQVTTFLTYNVHGQPLTLTDSNGVLTTLTYDSRQRLTSRTVGGETTGFTYWPTGLLKRSTLPDGSYVEYTYDGAHRLTQMVDGEANKVSYTLDAMGNQTAENVYDPSNALARTRTQVFNSLNQLLRQIGAAGTAAVTTSFQYDANGNQTVTDAPLGRSTTNQYDELNRSKQIVDPDSDTTQFGYDARDNLLVVTDPRSNVTGYTYNGFDELTVQVSPDTGTASNTYDAAGNLATSTDARNKTRTYSYDALNRLTSIVRPDNTTTFTYDTASNGIGRLSGAFDANHALAYSYDPQGRVISKTQSVGALSRTVGYGYTNGDLTSIVTPSGQTIGYGYSDGRVTSVTLNGSTTILNQVLYEPFGPVSGWSWGNNTLAARVYDPGWPTRAGR